MKQRKILAIVLAAMMLMSLLAGCGSSSGNTPAAPAAPAAEPAAPAAPASQGSTAPVEGPTANTGDLAGKTIALSSQHLGNQFNQGVLAGVTEQAKKPIPPSRWPTWRTSWPWALTPSSSAAAKALPLRTS